MFVQFGEKPLSIEKRRLNLQEIHRIENDSELISRKIENESN